MQENQPRPESGGRQFWHGITLFYWGFLTLLLWVPDPKELLFGWQPSDGPRGYAHIITFSLLGFLVELDRRKRSFQFWAIILILYTYTTEIVQELLPVRQFDFDDIGQDLTGVFLGLVFGMLVRRFFTRFPSQKVDV